MNTYKCNSLMLLIFFFALTTFASCKQEKREIQEELKSEKVISDSLKWSDRMALTLMKHHPEAYQIDDKTAPK